VKTTCFWTDDYPRPTDLQVADLPAGADILVIGGGITGLTAARRLARAGIDAAVVDSRMLGDGASAVNGGMAAYGLKVEPKSVIDRYGEDLGRELWSASNAAIGLIERITREESISCDFAQPGSAEFGFTDRDDRVLSEYARWTTRNMEFPIDYVPRNRLPDVVGSTRFSMAITDPISAAVHPAKYTFGLAKAAARSGVPLIENTEVTSVDRKPGGFTVATRRGRIRVGQILVATNGYTGTLFPSIRRGVVPIGSYSIVTEPLPADLAEEILPGNRTAWTSRRFLNYFRRTPDDRILIGGRRNLRTDLDLHASARDLRSRLLEFFPQLGPFETTHVWGGKLGATFDLLPHIGHHDGIWYAMGYGGHGVALGTYLGDEVASLMAGETEHSPFAEIPHPTRWYYRRRPWFLPLGALAFRALDVVGR
jgi:glycine/D-amino acid oxidase-like deaminating enzyme